MGNNEPLPPPPPPGFTPPPQQPQYSPPPQQYAPQQYAPQQYPPQQYAPVPQAPVPPKKNTGLIIGAAVVVVAAIVGGIVLLGGDDDKKSTGGSDNSVQISIDDSTPTDDTLVITVPVSNGNDDPNTTLGDEETAKTVTDDSKAFTVLVPSGLNVDTRQLPNDGNPISHISASADIKAYNDTHDTYGFSVLLAGPQLNVSVLDMLNYLAPKDGVCTSETEAAPVPSLYGDATVWLLEGCGTNGLFAKVIMAVPKLVLQQI